MASITFRIEIDMEDAREALAAFHERLLEIPEEVAKVVCDRFFGLLHAKPLEVLESPAGIAPGAPDGVVRLGIRGIGELCAAAFAASELNVSSVSHGESSV